MKSARQRQLIPLEFAPGVAKDVTADAPRGFWTDSQLIRWRNVNGKNFIEKMGGWQPAFSETTSGVIRSIYRYSSLSGSLVTCIGSTERFNIYDGEDLIDVTPVRLAFTGETNPLTTTSASAEVELAVSSAHGANVGDEIIISNASDTGGILAANINGLRTITEVVDTTTVKFTAGAAASSSTTGGGSVDVDFILSKIADDSDTGGGWGVTGWGEGDWGEPSEVVTSSLGRMPVWSMDNYGQDLVACRRGSGIYYMDYSNLPDRMVNVNTLPGASGVPIAAGIVIVSERDRHVIAFGAEPLTGGGSVDPMLIRWSSQEDVAQWTPSTTNTAGDLRLSKGTQIIAARQSRQEILVWTDTSMYSMRYIGGVYVFGIELIADGTDIAGSLASVDYNGVAYWFGRGGFYRYTGQIEYVPCPLERWLIDRVNWEFREKILCGTIKSEGEIIWFYPSTSSEEIDSYVIYNSKVNCWYYGSMVRTAWFDGTVGTYPIAAGTDGVIYQQEVPTAPSGPAWVESSYLEIGDGQDVMFADELIPDVAFLREESPTLDMTIRARDWPGVAYHSESENAIARTATVPVEQFTARKSIRVRGRAIALRISSDNENTRWRVGIPRLRARTDGQRV